MSHSWNALSFAMFVGCGAASTPATVGPATPSSTKVGSTADASGVSAADSRKPSRKLEEIKVLTCLELAEAIKKDSKLAEYRNVVLQVTDIVSDFEPTNGLLICSYGPQRVLAELVGLSRSHYASYAAARWRGTSWCALNLVAVTGL